MTVEDAGMLWRSFGGTSFGAPMRLLEMAGRIGDDELLVYAYCEAASDHLKGYWFTEKIARERIARIRETLREAEKKLERDDSPRARRGMRSVADILAKEIALTCSRVSGGRLVTPARHDKAKATSTAQITTGTAGRFSR